MPIEEEMLNNLIVTTVTTPFTFMLLTPKIGKYRGLLDNLG